MKIKVTIFIVLCIGFLVYSFSIYLKPLSLPPTSTVDIGMAVEGRLVWQKYNCQSCHQLYGLGGYLGPDLTNVYARRNQDIIKGIVSSGVKAMPAFHLSDQEFTQLIEFLKQANESGSADYREYEVLPNGMIKLP